MYILFQIAKNNSKMSFFLDKVFLLERRKPSKSRKMKITTKSYFINKKSARLTRYLVYLH